MLHVSPAGRDYIEKKEGLRLKAYIPLAGDVWTIGYGHTGPDVHEGLVWTKEQADQALTERLSNEFEPAVNRVCDGVPTTQGQFDAMASLSYNIGAPSFEHKSSVARLHRAGDYDGAADAFELWDKFKGQVNDALHNRRVEEGQMYLDASPGYAVEPPRFTPPTEHIAEPPPKPDGTWFGWVERQVGIL